MKRSSKKTSSGSQLRSCIRGVEKEGKGREELALAGAEEAVTELLIPSLEKFRTVGIISTFLQNSCP